LKPRRVLTCHLHRGEQQAEEDRDDADDNEQLDQGESATAWARMKHR
jgi:hypothetical protein